MLAFFPCISAKDETSKKKLTEWSELIVCPYVKEQDFWFSSEAIKKGLDLDANNKKLFSFNCLHFNFYELC